MAILVDGEKLWNFDTGETVYSLAATRFGDQQVIVAGSGEKVWAIDSSGKELWQYPMPKTESLFGKGLAKFAGGLHDIQKSLGYRDVFHLAAGKLGGRDVVVALAGLEHALMGPQVISSKGEHIMTLKAKVLGREGALGILGCMLDISPRGDAIVAVVNSYKGLKQISLIDSKGEITKKFDVGIDYAPSDRHTVGGEQDKCRGKLVAGKLDGTDAVVLGSPSTRSVGAGSLDGAKLWCFETCRKGDVNAGINDVAIGTMNGRSVVVIGAFNNLVHLVAGNGAQIDTWGYSSNVTNVACGKIKGQDAIAVGLYSGQILTYTVEPS
jgi:hypothetical protein